MDDSDSVIIICQHTVLIYGLACPSQLCASTYTHSNVWLWVEHNNFACILIQYRSGILALDWWPSGPGFNSHPLRCQMWLWASHSRAVTKLYKLALQHKLGGKQAHHATVWPHAHGSAGLADVLLRAEELQISTFLRAT